MAEIARGFEREHASHEVHAGAASRRQEAVVGSVDRHAHRVAVVALRLAALGAALDAFAVPCMGKEALSEGPGEAHHEGFATTLSCPSTYP